MAKEVTKNQRIVYLVEKYAVQANKAVKNKNSMASSGSEEYKSDSDSATSGSCQSIDPSKLELLI